MVSKQEIREAIVENLELNVRYCRSRGIINNRALSSYKLTKIVAHALWVLLEINGKFRGRYISEAAISGAAGFGVDINHPSWDHQIKKHLKKVGGQTFGSYFAFDHVVPKMALTNSMLAGTILPSEIEEHLIACVVTKGEHDRITKFERRAEFEFNLSDPWLSYKKLHINVFDKETKQPAFI